MTANRGLIISVWPLNFEKKKITMWCMTMKVSANIFTLLAFFVLVASAQNRTPQTHTRSMIHQTVYNTGELGRAFDGGQTGMTVGFSSMEWPPNSRIII